MNLKNMDMLNKIEPPRGLHNEHYVKFMSPQAIEKMLDESKKHQLACNVAVISICNPGNPAPKITENHPSLVLEFFDIGLPITDIMGATRYPMTEEQADEVVWFVNKVENWADYLYVNCEAGISRSAGVAGAIARAKFNYDIFLNNHYTPNMVCYRRVMDAFERSKNNKINSLLLDLSALRGRGRTL
jgi:predicted protein tyrosine phosphatase